MPNLLNISVPVTRRSTSKKARALTPPTPESELPAAALERRQPRPQSAVQHHRFRIGQRLRLVNAGPGMGRAGGTCRVVALMPAERGIFSYRVRNEAENFERIVPESDLAPIESP